MKDKVKFINLKEIKVGERFREDFGALEELIESIKTKGIIQPLTISTDFELLAGGRRYRAATEAGLAEVPVLIRKTAGELDAREIELIENAHRKDFSWQERAKLVARIHELSKEKNPLGPGRETSRMLGESPMQVSRQLKLAQAIEIIPTLTECKTAADAHKLLQHAEEEAILQEMSKRQQKFGETTTTANGAKQDDKKLANMLHAANRNYLIKDVFAGLKSLKANGHLDFIECDPPKEYEEFLTKLCQELYRVAGENCWMVFWFTFEHQEAVFEELTTVGWHVDRVPALWIKGNGKTPHPDLLLARAYEPFYICRKGNPTIIKQRRMNTWVRNVDDKKYHPAQRPVGLLKDILETFCDGMRYVLVPFAGSGATLRACYECGHQVIGFDNNPEYKDNFLLAVEEDGKKILKK